MLATPAAMPEPIAPVGVSRKALPPVLRRLGIGALPLGFLLLMLVLPTVALLRHASTLDPGLLWADAHLRGRFLWSLLQALITCVLALALGVPMAWVLARLEFAGRAALLPCGHAALRGAHAGGGHGRAGAAGPARRG